MMSTKDVAGTGQLPVFILLSIAISWAFWAPLIASAAGLLSVSLEITGGIGFILYIVAMTGMWIAAIPLIVRTSGFDGIKARFTTLLSLKKNALWYLVAILIPLAVEVLAPDIFALPGGEMPASLDWLYLLVLLILGVHIAIVLKLGGTGFALPSFGKGRSTFAASLLTGIYTIIWMMPMFLYTALNHPGYSLPLYVAGFIPVSIMIMWLYFSAK